MLCDPRDGSPPGSPVPGILQARTLEWVAISFSNAWKWKVKVKSLSHVWILATPWTAAYQAPPPMRFSRQEYWSGLPLPYPLHSHTAFLKKRIFNILNIKIRSLGVGGKGEWIPWGHRLIFVWNRLNFKCIILQSLHEFWDGKMQSVKWVKDTEMNRGGRSWRQEESNNKLLFTFSLCHMLPLLVPVHPFLNLRNSLIPQFT